MEILEQCGGATLHRITSSNTRGEEYLEAAGRNAMLGPEDMAVDENANDAGGNHIADVVRLVTMNVGGLCEDLGPAGTRMDEILTKLFADEKPDVLCFQEVTDEMYRERTAQSLILTPSPCVALILGPWFSFTLDVPGRVPGPFPSPPCYTLSLSLSLSRPQGSLGCPL